LDQAGVIARNVEDAAILADLMIGDDPKDSTSIPWQGGSLCSATKVGIEGFTVGVPRQARQIGGSRDLEALWSHCEGIVRKMGGRIKYIDLAGLDHALPAYYVIALCEASSNLARYDGVRFGYRSPHIRTFEDLYAMTRSEGFGEEVKRRIMLGTFTLSAGYYDQYFIRATKVRRVVTESLRSHFSDVDVMMWPTSPGVAFPLNSKDRDPTEMYLEDIFTVPVNMAGLPAISLPAYRSSELKLPMGIQFVGPQFGDAAIFSVAARFQSFCRQV